VAVGTCERCGSYYCASCYRDLGGKRLCSSCLAIPGVDYIAELRQRCWGKRDFWVWYLGALGTLSYAAIAIATLLAGNPLLASATACVAVISACYFLLQPWTRNAMFVVLALPVLGSFVDPTPLAGDIAYQAGYNTGAVLGRAAFLLLFLVAAYRSPRNKLAFKLDVPDAELAKYYDTYLANPAARRALAYGVASLIVPLLIPVALVFGVRAFRRADPNAWPPTGKRRPAITGLVCAGLSVVLWSFVILDVVAKNRNGG
jgi:hypothetical protein